MHRTLRTFTHLLTTALLATAQNIVPTSSSSTFPGCALSCSTLLQAQQLCLPPNFPANGNLAYDNCFCQSSLLGALYASPDAICTTECQIPEDRVLLQTWFSGFCQQVGRGIDPITATQSSSVVIITSTSTAYPTPTITGTGAGARPAPQSNESWIEGHWKWIMMLAILIVAFVAIAILLVWLRRRHRKKVEKQRAAASGFPPPPPPPMVERFSERFASNRNSATPALWGPHQHMHASNGWEYRNYEEESMVSGGVPASPRREKRKSRRERPSESHDEFSEVDRRPVSAGHRSQRSKGKHRESTGAAEHESRPLSTTNPESSVRRQKSRDVERERERERSPDQEADYSIKGFAHRLSHRFSFRWD